MPSNRKMKRQRQKTQKKFTKMAAKGKLRRHAKDKIQASEGRRKAKSQQRHAQIHQDWLIDRQHRKRERERVSDGSSDEEEEVLPMDMLDSDFPLDASSYAKMLEHMNKANNGGKQEEEDEEMDPEEWGEQVRTFVDEQELLPLKIDGRLVKRFRPAREEEEEMEEKPDISAIKEEMEEEDSGNGQERVQDYQMDDIAQLDEQQLAAHYARLLAQAESAVASAADKILMDPEENTSKFRLLLAMAAGEGMSPLVREQAQKLAVASLAELFVNVLPSYPVHVLSETEKSQRMKKETKRLALFEQSLLNYYLKYLKLLEKNATKLIGKRPPPDESTFSAQFGFLCARCLCRLAEGCAHFNCAPQVIGCLVRLSLGKWEKLLDAVCASLSAVFAADRQLDISLHGVKAIAALVDQKKAYVPAQLISTLLALNIREIDRKEGRKRRNGRVGQSKRAKKFDKQIGKLEVELEEAVAADAHSARLGLGRDVMRHVFLTYFRILRRMPQSALLAPVLQGLSKFVHLINVDFYDDLMAHLGRLVEQKQLKLSETLHCVRTAAHILTGEGQAIDVDLQRFYKALYGAMPSICFQPEPVMETDICLMAEAIQLLLIRRRKAVSPARAAAFAKRLALVSIPLKSSRCIVALLLVLRRLFLAHSSLKSLIGQEEEGEEDFLVVSGQFRPDCSDPDYCNGLSATINPELELLATHPNRLVQTLALHLLHGMPAAGKHRLDARWANMDTTEILTSIDPLLGDAGEEDGRHFRESIFKISKGQKKTTICSEICAFLSRTKKKR